MKKIILLQVLFLTTQNFPKESLANKVCDNFFEKLKSNIGLEDVLEIRPFKITQSFLNKLENNLTKGSIIAQRKKTAFEAVATSFYELSTELDKILSPEDQLQLAKEFDFAFEQKSSGYFDRLCGIERPDKLSLKTLQEMGREIYADFKLLLAKELELNKFVVDDKPLRQDFWPEITLISACDPALKNLANLDLSKCKVGIIYENSFAVEIVKNHKITSIIKFIDLEKKKLELITDEKEDFIKVLKLNFANKFEYYKKHFPEIVKKFEEVEHTALFYNLACGFQNSALSFAFLQSLGLAWRTAMGKNFPKPDTSSSKNSSISPPQNSTQGYLSQLSGNVKSFLNKNLTLENLGDKLFDAITFKHWGVVTPIVLIKAAKDTYDDYNSKKKGK